MFNRLGHVAIFVVGKEGEALLLVRQYLQASTHLCQYLATPKTFHLARPDGLSGGGEDPVQSLYTRLLLGEDVGVRRYASDKVGNAVVEGRL